MRDVLARLAFRMRDCFGLLWPEVVVVDFARPDVDFVDQSSRSYILLLLYVDILVWNVCCLYRRGEDCFRRISGGDLACCCRLLHDASVIHAARSLS